MILETKGSYPIWLHLIPKTWPGISFLVMSENKFILKGWCFANIKNVQKEFATAPKAVSKLLQGRRVAFISVYPVAALAHGGRSVSFRNIEKHIKEQLLPLIGT